MITCFSCEVLLNYKKEVLVCFIGYVNKIIAYSFIYDYNFNKIKQYSNDKISDNGAVMIKTSSNIIYNSSGYPISNSLVCFIDYFYDSSSCIIYNLEKKENITNSNSSINNYFLISTNLFIEYIDSNFFIFCFYSSTEFRLIKFHSLYGITEYKDYIINYDLIKNNLNYYFSILIYKDNVNDIFILLNNDENNFNLIKIKAEESNINIIDNKANILSNLLIYKIEKIINRIILGEKYYIIDKDFNISIYSSNNKHDDNETFIDLLNCQTKLKQTNNLNDNNILTIVQIEIYSDNNKTLTNNVRFVIYDENKKKLNLSGCDGEKVKINYKMKNNYEIFYKLEVYSDLGIDLLDIESPFFNDICYHDIIILNDEFLNLSKRIELLYINYSMCDNNCEYDKVNIKKRSISCNCTSLLSIESKIENPTFKQKELYFQFSSINIIKCSNFLFIKNTIKNFGFWISIILFLIRFVLYYKYFKTGISPIKNYIEKEMERYHYNIEEKETINKEEY